MVLPAINPLDTGRKALAKFNTFEAIVETRSFNPKLEIGANVLMSLSCALHYLEGNSVPISHMYPVFQGLFDFVQSLPLYRAPPSPPKRS